MYMAQHNNNNNNRPVYKSASILPYHHNGEEYLYLLAREINGNWCGSFGGRMEKRDRNNPWVNACRELGEELYYYNGKQLNTFINRVRKTAKVDRIPMAYPQKKHYDYFCQWNKIAPHTSPEEILQTFRSNNEIKAVHWVKANDLWRAMERVGKIYGKEAKAIWIPTYNDPQVKKIHLRPCFLDSCHKFYRYNKHVTHMTPPIDFDLDSESDSESD